MKFGRKFEQSKIPEWADFYVSYKLLKKLLSPFNALKKVYLRSTINNNTISIHNFSQEEITQLDQFSKVFETIIFEDLEKVLVFYTQQLSQVISKWKKIRINMMIFKERRDGLSKNAREQQFSMLKQAYQVLLRELKLMSDYITVNLEAFQKIIKKYHKAVKLFYPKDTLKIRLEKYLLETRIFIMRDRLNNFLSSVESEYVDAFYKNKVEGVSALRKIAQGSMISKNETFFFGLFSGFTALLLILIILLWVEEGHDVDEDQVLKEIFPMFRGMAIIIAYMGLLAWNVYGWTKYNVNYKLIFRFNHHYSQLSQILKRGAIFATILLLLVLWYLLLDADLGELSQGLDFIPKEVLPLILWASFVVYIFFPSFKIFNGPGRKYMVYMLKLVLKTPFIPVIFITIWATDQLTSFVLPLKDAEYTICYYISYFFYDEAAILRCQSSKRFTKSVIMAIVPLVLRILQCLRQVYDNHHGRRDPLLNTGKYSASLITSILSYMVTVSNHETGYLVAWIVFAAISTVYSFSWDLKKDWDFLQPNAKYRFLRDQLSYRNPVFYYMAISGNLLMRLVWVLSISPDIIPKITKPELFSFIIGFIEVFRRAVWNFLRVEKEHLANVGSFRAVPALALPYNDIVFNDQTKQDYFNTELEKIMHNNNKSEKPISVGSYLPYRTSLVSVAENYNRLDKPSSKINLQFASTNVNEVNLRSISAIPFKATAFGTMDEKEKEQLLKDLHKYREEEKSRYKRWKKEIDNFKQLLKLRQSKFVVIDVDNEPLIFQDIDTKKNGSPVKKENKHLQKDFKLKVIEENPEIYRTDLESSAHGNVEMKLEAPKITYQTNDSFVQTEEDRAETLTTDPDVPIIRKLDRIPTKTVNKVLGDVLSQEKSLWAQDQDTDGAHSKHNLDGSTSFQTKFDDTPRTDYRHLNNKKNHQLSLNSVDDTNTNRDNKVYLTLESPQNLQYSPLHLKADHEVMSLPSSAGRNSDDNTSPAHILVRSDETKTQEGVVFNHKDILITPINKTRQIHVKQSPRKNKPLKPAINLSDGKTSTGQSSGSD